MIFVIINVLSDIMLIVVCAYESLKWVNIALTNKVDNYPFSRLYCMFLGVIFAYLITFLIGELINSLNLLVS